MHQNAWKQVYFVLLIYLHFCRATINGAEKLMGLSCDLVTFFLVTFRRYAIKNLKRLRGMWNFNCSFFMKVCIFINTERHSFNLCWDFKWITDPCCPNTYRTKSQTMNLWKKVLKNLWKAKDGLTQNLSVPVSWYQGEPLSWGVVTLLN